MINNFNYFIFIFTIFITFLLVPQAKKISAKFELFDDPNNRKMHNDPKPRIGGLAVFSAFFISSIMSLIFLKISGLGYSLITIFLIFGFLFFLVGFLDDLYNLSPFIRLFFEIIFAILMMQSGFKINSFIIPLVFNNSNTIALPTIFSNIFSILWIVGITNALNWLDGLDGLLVSIVSIFNLVFLARFVELGNIEGLLISLIILASCLAFFNFNRFPSSIFLGDGGSYFLGFSISALSLLAFTTNNQEKIFRFGIDSFDIFGALLFLFIPLADMVRVIFLRIVNKKSPFYSDRNHLHHLMVDNGFSVNQTVLFILLLIIFSIFALQLKDNIQF